MNARGNTYLMRVYSLEGVITMLRRNIAKLITAVLTLTAVVAVSAETAMGQVEEYRRGVDYSAYIDHDRYINIEVWTDTDEYYEGDDITVYFRADKDCYVVLYNIDTEGNVNVLYPADQHDEIRVEKDRVYRIPDSYDKYDLTVNGPEGVEYIQAVASMMPLPIPDWGYSGPVVYNDEDPIDFMDYINAIYFGKENRIALDMTLFRVNEWHQAYYRPVHVYHNYDWDLSGMVYIDYPWGATIYIDGIYWGIAPLYIPRIYYGWHWITVYDRYGYCWENRIQVVRHRTIILDDNTIHTRQDIKSRYRDVQKKGYLNPDKNGYPDYSKNVRTKQAAMDDYKSKRAAGKTGLAFDRSDSRTKRSAEGVYNSLSGQSSSRSKSGTTSERQSGERGTKSSEGDSYDRSSSKSRSSSRETDKSNESYRSRGTKSSESSGSSNSRDNEYRRGSSSRSSSSSSGGEYKRSSSSRSSGSNESSGSSSRSKSSGSSSRSSDSGSSSSKSGSSDRSSGSDNSGGSSKRGR